MQVVRNLGSNAAVCVDGDGGQLVALGKGVGFGKVPRELDVSSIERTFYDVDARYLPLIQEMDPRELAYASDFADLVRQEVSHELSPNLVFALADHISFAIKRAREHLYVSMPLSYDVQQQYPVEYELGKLAVSGINKTFDVRLPPNEAVGIAMSIINSTVAVGGNAAKNDLHDERLIDAAASIIESDFDISVDRESFDFSRFATHLRYLLMRVRGGSTSGTDVAELLPTLEATYPRESACATKIAQLIVGPQDQQLSDDETAYLILHVMRVTTRHGGGEITDAI